MKMNSAWQKNQRREIRRTLGRYLAILAIIALGVGFFSGLKVTRSAMVNTGDVYIKAHDMFDFRVISTLGLTDEDVAYFSTLDGVEYAEGAESVDFIAFGQDGNEQALAAHSITDRLNTLSITAGRMPDAPDECVLDARYFSNADIGRTIKVAPSNDQDTFNKFAYKKYTIVGLADSVSYLNRERGSTKLPGGTIYGFVYIPKDGFSMDYYTEAYLTLKDKNYLFSSEYDSLISSVKPAITDALEKRADIRYRKIVDDANDEAAGAETEYNSSLADYQSQKADAEAKLSDAKKQLDDALSQIEDHEAELADSEKQLADAQARYENGLASYNQSKSQYESARSDTLSQLDAAQSQIDTQRASVQSGMQQIESSGVIDQYNQLTNTIAALDAQIAVTDPADPAYAVLTAQLAAAQASLSQIEQSGVLQQYQSLKDSLAQLDAAQNDLDSKESDANARFSDTEVQLWDAKVQLESSLQQIESAKNQIAAGRRQLRNARADYESGLSEYESEKADTEEKLSDGQKELDDAKSKIEVAKEDISDIEPADCYTLDRSMNTGYSCFKSDSSIVDGISKIFPVFFFLVAALVCTTTMTRMVEEHRTQIGTLKALGYGNGIIVWKYIWYAGSAAIIGCILGFLGGTILFPWAIWKAYGMLYGFAPIQYVFDVGLAALSLGVSLLCSAGATYVACRTELFQMPAELMRPKAPKAGKRILLEKITFLWKRISFLHKVSIRNILRYKRRLFMMILGIGGCTALVLTGFGLRDSISNIANDQFSNIWKYDYAISFSDARTQEDMNSFVSDTSGILSRCVFICSESADVICADGTAKSVNLIATDDNGITDLVDLHNGSGPVAYPTAGDVVINEKLAKLTGVSAGGKITVQLDDKTSTFTVSGIFDNYVYNYMYMTVQTYTSAFGKTCEMKNALAKTDSSDIHGVSTQLINDYKAAGVSVIKDIRDRVDNMMKSLNYIVLLVISCAGALAFVVLFNLSNINITERMREIATIKVLGFYSSEVRAYVFRENIVLTAVGALLGIPLGIWLHRFVMSQIQIDMVSFQVNILPQSYVLALVLTFAFTFAVDLMMQSKLNKISMAESMKSVE